MIKVFHEDQLVDIKRFNFSGGEVQVRLENLPDVLGDFTIQANIRSSDDIMAVLLLRDAINCISTHSRVHLICPYFPYARQDRSVYKGEAFGARVMSGLLNNANFETITVWDIHSDVSLEMLNNTVNRPASDFVVPHLNKNEFIVAPDHGAKERAMRCSDLSGNSFLQMSKKRDPNTGYLSLFSLDSLVDDFEKDYGAMIVDDICDGGRTFIGGGNILKQHIHGPLRLFVTHGIFSAGFDGLLEVFDEILVANLMTDAPLPPQVKVIGS